MATAPPPLARVPVGVRVGPLRRRLGGLLAILALSVVSLLTLAPLGWTIATSLRTPIESFTVPPEWIPRSPQWSNYRDVFDEIPYMRYLINSIVVTGSIVVGQLITSALGGYAFARLRFPGKNVLFWLILATLMVPLQATIIPVFVLISKLGLADTRASLILPAWTTAFGIFLLRQHFLSIPNEYGEAAILDGASQWQVFWSVYLPLASPRLAILAVLAFNFHWNEFFRPLIFLSSNDNFTLPLGVVTLFGYLGTGSISVVLAAIVMSFIPVLVVYVIGQRYLVEGLMMGGIKS